MYIFEFIILLFHLINQPLGGALNFKCKQKPADILHSDTGNNRA